MREDLRNSTGLEKSVLGVRSKVVVPVRERDDGAVY